MDVRLHAGFVEQGAGDGITWLSLDGSLVALSRFPHLINNTGGAPFGSRLMGQFRLPTLPGFRVRAVDDPSLTPAPAAPALAPAPPPLSPAAPPQPAPPLSPGVPRMGAPITGTATMANFAAQVIPTQPASQAGALQAPGSLRTPGTVANDPAATPAPGTQPQGKPST